MAINERPSIMRYISIPRQVGKTWAEKQWLEIDYKGGIMIIEIAEKDFKEIQDKIGAIRSSAVAIKMERFNVYEKRLNLITSWANEITALLHKGVIIKDIDLPKFKDIIGLYADPPNSTTKFVERYDYWICEKCGYERKMSMLAVGWKIDDKDEFISCAGCGREVAELVPLVREGG